MPCEICWCLVLPGINKMKIQHLEWEKQLSEWEKIFANEATDKGLTSTIYIKLMQLYIRKNKNSIKKIGGGRPSPSPALPPILTPLPGLEPALVSAPIREPALHCRRRLRDVSLFGKSHGGQSGGWSFLLLLLQRISRSRAELAPAPGLLPSEI